LRLSRTNIFLSHYYQTVQGMAGIKMEMDVKMEMGLKSEIKTEMNDGKQESMELVRGLN